MKTYCLSLLSLAGLLLPASADIQCWAPHMGTPAPMANNAFSSFAGKPYRYVIKGFQGWICLGGTDSSATPDANGVFHKNSSNGNGTTVASTSQVTLSVNGRSIPLTLSVAGESSGTGTGLVVQNLATPITFDNPTGDPITFSFTRSGSNTSSYGVFYVVGEYINEDPLKGTLSVPTAYLIRGTTTQQDGSANQQAVSTPLTYSIEREPQVISPPLPPLNVPSGNTPTTPSTSTGPAAAAPSTDPSTSTGHDNNGHGNNVDGVDLSNPGQGHGGPTGVLNAGLDPSKGVDDEASGSAKKVK